MKKVLLPYLQSVQAALLIYKDVTRAVFSTFTAEATEAAKAWLWEILSSGDFTQAFGTCFGLLLDDLQSPALKEHCHAAIGERKRQNRR